MKHPQTFVVMMILVAVAFARLAPVRREVLAGALAGVAAAAPVERNLRETAPGETRDPGRAARSRRAPTVCRVRRGAAESVPPRGCGRSISAR